MRVKINTTSTGAYRFGYKRGPSDTSFVPEEKKEKKKGKRGRKKERRGTASGAREDAHRQEEKEREREKSRERRVLCLVARFSLPAGTGARGSRHILGIPKAVEPRVVLSPSKRHTAAARSSHHARELCVGDGRRAARNTCILDRGGINRPVKFVLMRALRRSP